MTQPNSSDSPMVIKAGETLDLYVMPGAELNIEATDEMTNRAVRELHKHLEGFVCHLPVDDPDWRYYATAVLRAAFTGETTERIR